MKAIERLKELGCQTYYLGKRATSLYALPSTEKETSMRAEAASERILYIDLR